MRLRNVQPARISRSAAASSCTTARVVSAPAVSRTFGSSRRQLAIRASGQGIAHPGEEAHKGETQQPLNAHLSVPNVTMAKGGGGGGKDMGSGSSLSMVMERSKLEFVMPTPPQQAPKLDDGGSGGGDGKHNHNGGGGGDDGGDDDDYFGGEGDGEGDGQGGGGGGDGFFRTALPELYDRLTIAAVLQEWYKTVVELPLFIRRAVEMGLFSSAQLVRFLSMDVRPGVARSVSRTLPSEWARGFVGRLMADPAFIQKLVFEQLMAFSASMVYEWRVRGDNFKQELDYALINSVGMMAAVGATVWITAPSRAYGAVHKFPWQQMLANLPHCVFDASGPLRHYSNTARLGGFFASMAQLSAVGAIAGGATSLASQACVKAHEAMDPEYQGPSVPVADAARSSAGLGAFFAVNANTRYQLLGGMDRYLFNHTNFLWTYMGMTLLSRGLFTAAGEASRPWWQGLTTDVSASHVARSKKVRRVRRKVNKSGTAPTHVVSGAERQAQLAAAAAAAAMAVDPAAAGVDGSSSGGLADYQPIAAAVGEDSSSMESAAAALAAYQPISAEDSLEVGESQQAEAVRGLGALEAAAHQQLQSAPAVMGSATALQDLVLQQQQPGEQQQQPQLQHLPSMSDTAMGAALRDAVSATVGVNA